MSSISTQTTRGQTAEVTYLDIKEKRVPLCVSMEVETSEILQRIKIDLFRFLPVHYPVTSEMNINMRDCASIGSKTFLSSFQAGYFH